jgi:transcriptional/translational regulatory protein YebC/TACO1
VEAGADNVETSGDTYEVTTKPTDFIAVKDALEKKFGPSQSAEIIWKPNSTTAVSREQAKDLIDLIEALEDYDDVQTVFTNFEVDDAVMAQLMVS